MNRFVLVAAFVLVGCKEIRINVSPTCEPTGSEICDNQDNDCNGLIDDMDPVACNMQCGIGVAICIRGTLTECIGRQPSEEVCDGIDNDCDGQIDEIIRATPCYPGNPDTLGYGECHYGTNRCVDGQLECVGFQTPSPEICDGKDNDCDGTVDTPSNKPTDIVIAMDWSGSMDNKLTSLYAQLQVALSTFTLRNDMRVALLGIPYYNAKTEGRVDVVKDFVTVNTMIAYLKTLPQTTNGGNEASIDAIMQVSMNTNPLSMSFASGSNKMLVLITDEEPQSFSSPKTTLHTAMMTADMNNTRVLVFSEGPAIPMWQTEVKATYPMDSYGVTMPKLINEFLSNVICK